MLILPCLFIGETTQQLHERFGDHRRSINNHWHQLTNPTPISHYFTLLGHSIDDIQLIPRGDSTSYEVRGRIAESPWEFQVRQYSRSFDSRHLSLSFGRGIRVRSNAKILNLNYKFCSCLLPLSYSALSDSRSEPIAPTAATTKENRRIFLRPTLQNKIKMINGRLKQKA